MNFLARGAKELDEEPDVSSTFQSILEVIKQTNVESEESVQETYQRLERFFSVNSLNDTDIDDQFIELSKQLLNTSNSIEIVRFGITCFSIMVVQRKLETDLSFLENMIESLSPLAAIDDEIIISRLFLVYSKLALPSIECANLILSTINFEQVEGLIKTTTDVNMIHSVLEFYSSILNVLGNKMPIQLLLTAFSCIEFHVKRILPTDETVEVEPAALNVLIDIVKFLAQAGSNEVWDTCFKQSGLLPYCNKCLLYIKKTSLRVQVLRLMKRVCNNPLINSSDINYERIFELMHHPTSAISQEAVNCVFSVNHVDLNRLIESSDLIAHVIELIKTQSMKVKEKCILFLCAHSSSIKWNDIANPDFIEKLYELFAETQGNIQDKIAFMLINMINAAEKADPEKHQAIKDMLIELGAIDTLTETCLENSSASHRVQELLEILDPPEE